MNPMMGGMGGGMGGMSGGMAPQQTLPNQQSMMMLLQMLQDPMGSAMALPPQGPLTPEEQVMLAIMGQGKQPQESQMPGMMQLLQMLGGGGMGGGMPMGAPPGMMPPTGGAPPMY